MEHIKAFLIAPFIWLMRFRYRRGFGVQSPFAFDFICNVINGQGEYYAYKELKAERQGATYRECANSLKMDKFLFRISNFVHPLTIFVEDCGTAISRRYMSEGCASASCYVFHDAADLEDILKVAKTVGLLYVDSAHDCARVLSVAEPFLTEDSAIIIKGIHRNGAARHCWKTAIENTRAILSFDLYTAGIIFRNSKYIKQHYMVNF